MSTIELIINSLQNTAKEKSKSLDEVYITHSRWLQNELMLISKIIQQNPREGVIITKETPLIEEPQNQSKKRKSPEMAFSGPKLSPEQKRSSIDTEELFVSAGLPSDPNKLKKQQLLSELENRGISSFTMKNTKDVLIEALKDCLLSERRAAASGDNTLIVSVNEQQNQKMEEAIMYDVSVPVPSSEAAETQKTQNQEFPACSTTMESNINGCGEVIPPPCSPLKTPGRKGSLMQDFRSMVNNNQTNVVDHSNDDSKRIESEFKNRYRASQVRKSQILDQPSVSSSGGDIKMENIENHDVESSIIATADVSESAATTQSADTVIEDSVGEMSDSDHEKVGEGESTWTEVSSPGIEKDNGKDDLSATSESTKSSDSQPYSSNLPGNSQSNSLDKPFVKSTIIVAGEKAKPTKVVEAVKKKEQEHKSMKISKILSPPWKTKQQPVSKITNGSEANQPPIKKGLFGIFGGKKQPTVETKPSAFDISVVDAKKGVCDNQNLEFHSKAFTVETPETVPQMTTTPAPTLVVKPSVSSIIEKYNKAVAETKEASPKEPSSAKTQLSLMPQNPPTSNPTNVGPITNAVVNTLVETKAPLQEIKEDTPKTVVEVPKEPEVVEDEEEAREEYAIEDRGSSDDESGSGTDDEESNRKNQQRIPDWAQGQKLREALERQFGLNGNTPMDPDQIFPEVQTCNLEEIFGRREGVTRKYANRSSSAHWEPDQLTLVEKRQYRTHMGYGGKTPQSGIKIH